MFLIVDFGKKFSHFKVLDTTDSSVEEVSITSLAKAIANGLEVYPMYIRVLNLKQVQNGNGYLVEKKGGVKIVIPYAILNQYVNGGYVIVSK